MDEHIPQSILERLRQRGIDVLTAQKDNYRGTPEPILLDRATNLQRVIFSQIEENNYETASKQKLQPV